MINPFKFSSIWAFLPFSYMLLFLPQSMIGFFYLDKGIAFEVIKIFCLGLIAYFAGYQLNKYFRLKNQNIKFPAIEINDKQIIFFTFFIFTIYILILLLAILTSGTIPLWNSLSGKSSLDIATSREMLFRSQVGVSGSLIYLHSILTSVFIPYLLMILFINKIRLAKFFYAIFFFGLLIPMEKILFIKALLPFFLIAVNGYLSRRSLLISILVILVTIISMGFLVLGNDKGKSHGSIEKNLSNMEEWQINRCIDIFQNGKCLSYKEHLNKYYPLVDSKITISTVGNRIIWIPYITAYDWIDYFQNRLNSIHTDGRTSLLVSKLLGKEKVPMEQLIFDYQFGLGKTQSAGANTNFMIDGYVNFGMIGVILLSIFVGFIIAAIEQLKNPAACACIYLFLFQLLGGGFLGTFLGGGLLLYLLIVFFFKPIFQKNIPSSS